MSMNSVDPFSRLAERAPAPSDRVLASLREEMKKDDLPRKVLSLGQRVALSVGALVLALLLTTAGALENAPSSLLIAGAALSITLGGLLLSGLVPGQVALGSDQNSPLSLTSRRMLVAVLAIFGLLVLVLQSTSMLSMSEFLGEESMKLAIGCAGHSLLSGVIGASALLFIWRRSDPYSPGLTGALLGLFGGIAGTVSVGLLCEHREGLHLTLSHGLSLVVLLVLGFFVGRKWLNP